MPYRPRLNSACAFRKSYPNVMVVQPRQDWDGYNDPNPLHSTYAFCHGDPGEIGRSRMPIALTRDVKACPLVPFPPRIMYFDTVDWATSKPSINSSPWIRDAPHLGFSLLIRRMRSRNSRSIFGRPARCRDFQRQNAVKPARCPRRMVSG